MAATPKRPIPASPWDVNFWDEKLNPRPVGLKKNDSRMGPMVGLVPPAPAPGTGTPIKPPGPPGPTKRRTGGSGGGGGSASQAKTAKQLREIATYNAGSATGQLDNALADYDLSDRQNQSLADVQFQANSKQSAGDRFAQAKKLQSSTRGVLAAAGNALQGSQLGSLAGMVQGRTDLDNGEMYGTLSQNQAAVQNALTESKNQNVLARRDAYTNAEFALRGVEADTAAQLASLNPKFYKTPGSGLDLGSKAIAARRNTVAENKAKAAGYFMPDNAVRPKASAMQGNSYFDRLLNAYNRRSA